MRARDVVGKRIVAVRQQRFKPRRYGDVRTALCSLALDDGTVLSFQACEGDAEPYVEGHVWKEGKQG